MVYATFGPAHFFASEFRYLCLTLKPGRVVRYEACRRTDVTGLLSSTGSWLVQPGIDGPT